MKLRYPNIFPILGLHILRSNFYVVSERIPNLLSLETFLNSNSIIENNIRLEM